MVGHPCPPLARSQNAVHSGQALVVLLVGSGMRRVVDLGQVLEIEMGVDLRGRYVRVAQQLLNCAQVARRLQ